MIPHCSFDLHSLIIIDVEDLYLCLLITCESSLEKCLFTASANFLIELLIFVILSCVQHIYFGDEFFCQLFHLQLFSPILRIVF